MIKTVPDPLRAPLANIIQAVEAEHGVIDYQADPEALEYFESLDIAAEHTTLEQRITAESSHHEAN